MLPTEILLLDSDAPKTGRIDGISFDTTPPDALILLSVGILCYRISSEPNSIINFIKDNIEINVVTTPPDFSSTTTTCQQTTDFIQAQISAAPAPTPSSNTKPQSPCTVTVVLNTSSFNESTMYVFKARRSNVAVIIVKVIFISPFLFYCLLSKHSLPTNPNKMTNCFKLILLYYNFTNYIYSNAFVYFLIF